MKYFTLTLVVLALFFISDKNIYADYETGAFDTLEIKNQTIEPVKSENDDSSYGAFNPYKFSPELGDNPDNLC